MPFLMFTFKYFVSDYGPAMTEHCLQTIGFPENVKVGKGFNVTEGQLPCNRLHNYILYLWYVHSFQVRITYIVLVLTF